MSWIRIDDRYATHRKIMRAGPTAMALDVAGMCYAAQHGTDGHIPTEALAAAAPFLAKPKALAAAAKLVEVGRWTVAPDGWQIHDFLVYNPTAADRAARQQQTVDRVRRHRQKKREGNALTRNAGNAAPSPHPRPAEGGDGDPPTSPHPQPPSGPASPEPSHGADSAGPDPSPPDHPDPAADPGDQPKRLDPAPNGALPLQVVAALDEALGPNWRRRRLPESRPSQADLVAEHARKLAEFEAKFAQELNASRSVPEQESDP